MTLAGIRTEALLRHFLTTVLISHAPVSTLSQHTAINSGLCQHCRYGAYDAKPIPRPFDSPAGTIFLLQSYSRLYIERIWSAKNSYSIEFLSRAQYTPLTSAFLPCGPISGRDLLFIVRLRLLFGV